jgi:hypothetical protein
MVCTIWSWKLKNTFFSFNSTKITPQQQITYNTIQYTMYMNVNIEDIDRMRVWMTTCCKRSTWKPCSHKLCASNCFLMSTQQFFSYLMDRTSNITMRWWWFPLCARPTGLIEY